MGTSQMRQSFARDLISGQSRMKKVDGQKVSDWAIYEFESGQSERIKLIERMWTVHQNSYLEHTLTLFALCG